jgi:hypothetical protein
VFINEALAATPEIPATGSVYDYVHLVISTACSPQILALVVIWLFLRQPELVGRITNLDFFGFKVQLADIKQQIASTNQKLAEVDGKLSTLQESYLKQADTIPIHAPAQDLDSVATLLKNEARTLENIDFAARLLSLDAEPGHVLAAAAAIQVRPEPKFFAPLTDFLCKLAATSNLNGIRMKIVYRLVMGLQNIARADNARGEKLVDDAQRNQASNALTHLKNHPLCQADFESAGARSIIPRIEATLKVCHPLTGTTRHASTVGH